MVREKLGKERYLLILSSVVSADAYVSVHCSRQPFLERSHANKFTPLSREQHRCPTAPW